MRTFVEQVGHYFDRPSVGVPTAPVGGPAAWTANDVGGRDVWRLPLSSPALAELESHVHAVEQFSMQPVDAAQFPALAEQVEGWRHDLVDGRGFVVVSGFPVDRWSDAQRETACWIVGCLMGEPGGQNADGDLLGHVIDLAADNHENERLYRTNKNIGFHCDAADVVGLLTVSTAPTGGDSRVVSSVSVHDRMVVECPELAARLFQPTMLDSRRPPGSPTRYSEVVPSAFDGQRLRTFMHLEYFRSVERFDDIELDDVTRRALDTWESIAEEPGMHVAMRLEVGDLQLVNNHTIVHARTGYVDDPDNPRHLLRLWLSLGG